MYPGDPDAAHDDRGASQAPERLVDRMLEVLEFDLVSLTRPSVARGNKIFGAAVLVKSTCELVVASVNRETENPLWHGEIACLNDYWAMPERTRPPPAECYFLSTHEPCSMCLSAITWSGFDNFYYFFSYEDSRDLFEIPHDLRILDEVFDCKQGEYMAHNAYWRSHSLNDLVESDPGASRGRRLEQAARIRSGYAELSVNYQDNKGAAGIPLA